MTQGVRFREIDGRRSSQEAGKTIFAKAASGADAALAEEISGESAWRKRYLGPVRRLVEAGARSRASAIDIARRGLAALHEQIEFAGGDESRQLTEAVREGAEGVFRTEVLEGTGTGARPELSIPYRGRALRGDEIRRQLDRWVEGGIVEPSCREAVEKVLANPDWLDLSDRRFVLLGAGAEMGALSALCTWGAEVAAVDVPSADVWKRILATAREGRGRVSIPVRVAGTEKLADSAGADLLNDTPEIAGWLRSFERPLTIVDDTYADGSSFVLLASATDAIMSELARENAVAFAYLATPTDVFAVPEDVAIAARSRRRAGRGPMRAVSGGSLYRPAYQNLIEGEGGTRWGIVDCLVAQQGANYALAKTLQRWRAVAARENGTAVSANVAPATRTRSVTRNKALAAAYRGASSYGIEIFEPETSRWLMAALLVHDLRNDGGGFPPSGHPYELFVQGAAHGGIWRLGYEPRSVLPLAVVRGLLRRS